MVAAIRSLFVMEESKVDFIYTAIIIILLMVFSANALMGIGNL